MEESLAADICSWLKGGFLEVAYRAHGLPTPAAAVSDQGFAPKWSLMAAPNWTTSALADAGLDRHHLHPAIVLQPAQFYKATQCNTKRKY